MLQYWSNLFAMLSVALVATAFFRDDWQAGFLTGGVFAFVGAWFHGLALPAKGGRK